MQKLITQIFIVFSVVISCIAGTIPSDIFSGNKFEGSANSRFSGKNAKFTTMSGNSYGTHYGNVSGNITGNLNGVVNSNRVDSSLFTNLSTAVHDSSTAGKVVVVSTGESCNTLTIPKDRIVEIIKGGTINNSGTLTFLTHPIIGEYEVFVGSGAIIGLYQVLSEWFGSVGDGIADDGVAIRKAISAITSTGGILFFPKDKYLLTGATANADGVKNGILIPWSGDFYGARKAITIKGKSEGTTLLAGESSMAVIRASNPHTNIENISIEGGITGGGAYTKYPTYPNPAHTNVYGILVGPEDITATTPQISTSYFTAKNLTLSWNTYALYFKTGPMSSGAYANTLDQLHITDNIVGISFALPTDVGSIKNLTTSTRINNSYIAYGNLGIDATGVSGLKIVNSYIEKVNAGTSPRATPTGIYIHDLIGAGFNYGHHVQLVNTEIEQDPGDIPIDNADATTSMINSNYNRATSVGEHLISSFNKNGVESSGRQMQLRLMDQTNKAVAFEVSNKPDNTAGALFSTYDIHFGGASNGTIFAPTTSKASITYNGDGVLNLNADPNNISAQSSVHIRVDGSSRVIIPPDSGLQLVSITNPTCDTAHAGTLNYVNTGAGSADTIAICAKDATNTYAWRTLWYVAP